MDRCACAHLKADDGITPTISNTGLFAALEATPEVQVLLRMHDAQHAGRWRDCGVFYYLFVCLFVCTPEVSGVDTGLLKRRRSRCSTHSIYPKLNTPAT